jgi:Acetyltransferase (GNAT) domain
MKTDSVVDSERNRSGSLNKQKTEGVVPVNQINPLQDSRWPEFLNRNPRASVFHSPAWLDALRRTYGYEPTVLTTAGPGEKLCNGITFCLVSSWLTGRRMVSVPFSDHCEPLVQDREELSQLVDAFVRDSTKAHWKYVEIRPVSRIWEHLNFPASFGQSNLYYHHQLDLRPPLEQLRQAFHKDCVQRKIRRAEREGLICEEGRSKRLLDQFYRLLILTRQRHRLPPQPRSWFHNLIDCFGDSLKIFVASKNGRPAAAILTLQYKTFLAYKYGCSDIAANKLGGMQLLLWRAIQQAKESGIETLDMGRTDWNNPGLVDFKERWGATRSILVYARCPRTAALDNNQMWWEKTASRVFDLIPSSLLSSAGKILYKHIG